MTASLAEVVRADDDGVREQNTPRAGAGRLPGRARPMAMRRRGLHGGWGVIGQWSAVRRMATLGAEVPADGGARQPPILADETRSARDRGGGWAAPLLPTSIKLASTTVAAADPTPTNRSHLTVGCVNLLGSGLARYH